MNRRPPVLALIGAAAFSVLFSVVLLEIALHVVGYPRTKTSHQRFYVEHDPQRGWRNVPNDVWGFTLGGYPVVNKWLSYREKAILGRSLTDSEVVYVSEIVRRLSALLELASDLNANYEACANATIPPK